MLQYTWNLLEYFRLLYWESLQDLGSFWGCVPLEFTELLYICYRVHILRVSADPCWGGASEIPKGCLFVCLFVHV